MEQDSEALGSSTVQPLTCGAIEGKGSPSFASLLPRKQMDVDVSDKQGNVWKQLKEKKRPYY